MTKFKRSTAVGVAQVVMAVGVVAVLGALTWNLWETTAAMAPPPADHQACSVYGRLDRTSPAVRNGTQTNAPGIFCWPEDASNQEIIVPYGQKPYLAGVMTQADLDQAKAVADAATGPAIATVEAERANRVRP
jgi:hypothetical protein